MTFGVRQPESGLERLGRRVRTMSDLGRVRAVSDRLPFELPARRAGAGTVVMAALAGAVIGAALMYVMDPERGRRRRALIRDRVSAIARQTSEAMDDRSRDVVNRARGLVIELRSRLPGAAAPETSPSTGDEEQRPPRERQRPGERRDRVE
jgi:hypothetical protein